MVIILIIMVITLIIMVITMERELIMDFIKPSISVMVIKLVLEIELNLVASEQLIMEHVTNEQLEVTNELPEVTNDKLGIINDKLEVTNEQPKVTKWIILTLLASSLISKHCFKLVLFLAIQLLVMVHVFLLLRSLMAIKQRFKVSTNKHC